ncbi:MAG TPA: hypothetical protein VKY74_20660 [Chloroflexia bacterium]|nr:hypothetical protein [Chloroflexia bacterium]
MANPANGTAPAAAVYNLGKNVVGHIEGSKLILEIDLTQNFGASASGKSTIIATTSGNVAIPDTGAKLGLNIYK